MNKFKDSGGKWRTQGLFLETSYDPNAMFTLTDTDKTWKGNKYPSLRQLYLATDDPTEYTFATKHLGGWMHWKRLRGNKMLAKKFDEWQDELAIKLASKGVKIAIEIAADGGTFQAAKWLADSGWKTRLAGRPSKDEIEGELKKQARESDEFADDLLRIVR
jgi:hypothetical protein|tara:strand:+ start:179 stop:661 length:483 start_codon:yes stop_codon:yes gene_type:complete